MKIGLFPGKFNIIHQGHISAALEAYSFVDHLYIVVLYDEEYEEERYTEFGIPVISPWTRERWWKTIMRDLENVTVLSLSSKNTFNFCDWEQSTKEMLEVTGPVTDIFSSELEYETFFKKLYPTSQIHTLIKKRGISATQIFKEGIYASWSLLPRIVQNYFVQKIVILGAESSGKTTLTRKLALWYQTEKVEEVARRFWEYYGGGFGKVLDSEDYKALTYQQKNQEYQKIKKANRFLFIDTETIVTQVWLNLYENTELTVLDAIANDEKYDLYLLIKPDLPFVQDGTRNFEKERLIIYQKMKEHLIKYNKPYVVLAGTASQQFEQARCQIEKRLI